MIVRVTCTRVPDPVREGRAAAALVDITQVDGPFPSVITNGGSLTGAAEWLKENGFRWMTGTSGFWTNEVAA